MTLDLPTPIETYFASEKTDGTEILGDIFANDAVVQDESATHLGLEAIRAWKSEGKRTTGYTVEPQSADQIGDQFAVSAKVEGRFPGSPVVLKYLFSLIGDRIAKLEIK